MKSPGVNRVVLQSTNAAHIHDGSAGGEVNCLQEVKDPYETAPDGNAVVIEEQMVKMNETELITIS